MVKLTYINHETKFQKSLYCSSCEKCDKSFQLGCHVMSNEFEKASHDITDFNKPFRNPCNVVHEKDATKIVMGRAAN